MLPFNGLSNRFDINSMGRVSAGAIICTPRRVASVCAHDAISMITMLVAARGTCGGVSIKILSICLRRLQLSIGMFVFLFVVGVVI